MEKFLKLITLEDIGINDTETPNTANIYYRGGWIGEMIWTTGPNLFEENKRLNFAYRLGKEGEFLGPYPTKKKALEMLIHDAELTPIQESIDFAHAIYSMPLGDSIEWYGYEYSRVPGGWIVGVEYNEGKAQSFVPYSDEFKLSEKTE